jgi:hypothetical protein
MATRRRGMETTRGTTPAPVSDVVYIAGLSTDLDRYSARRPIAIARRAGGFIRSSLYHVPSNGPDELATEE